MEFAKRHVEPGLYIAATPIGNLGDVTIRVLETLVNCDIVACEDTRVTAKLLRHFGIVTKTIAYHEHNAVTVGPKLLDEIEAGKSVVLVSDAGTPIVSDPGFRLVEEAQTRNVPIIALPGPTAPVTALVTSGLPAETWLFGGFLPSKQGARRKRLEELKHVPATLIFFESPNRTAKALADMANVLGEERQGAVARELTKLHEEIMRGTLGELSSELASRNLKGEVVLLAAPPGKSAAPENVEELLTDLLKTMPVREAAAEAADLTGQSKRELYQMALKIRDQ